MKDYTQVYQQYISDTANHTPPGSYHKFRTEGIYLKFKNWLPEEGIDYDIIRVHQGDNCFHFDSIAALKEAIRDDIIEIDYEKPWQQMFNAPDLWKSRRQITINYLMSKRQVEERLKHQEKRDKERVESYKSTTFSTIEDAVKYIKSTTNNQQ